MNSIIGGIYVQTKNRDEMKESSFNIEYNKKGEYEMITIDNKVWSLSNLYHSQNVDL